MGSSGCRSRGVGYSAHRIRLRQLLAVERIRTRIATDLHDDIGSSLSRIAILTDVASRKLDGVDQSVRPALQSVGDSARELMDDMGVIVWAISPKHDGLEDLVGRMRRFASDVLTSANIDLQFTAPESGVLRTLGADVRRELFLIFKESVNNLVKHARCQQAVIILRVAGRTLHLTVSDDGRGFVRDEITEGHGLRSLSARATRLGASFVVDSAPGRGTTVSVQVPLGHSWNPLRWMTTYSGGDAGEKGADSRSSRIEPL